MCHRENLHHCAFDLMLIIHIIVNFLKEFFGFHSNCKKFPCRNADCFERQKLDEMLIDQTGQLNISSAPVVRRE